MRTLRIAITLTAAAVLLVTASAQSLEVELQRATQKETVTGDLKAAIEEYRKVAARAGSNRKVAAQALIRMAECHQKLGDAESRKIYERILREYADQEEAAALARTRLGANESAASGKGDRPLWTGPDVDIFGKISPDGRFLTYIDWSKGDLMLHDMVTGANHSLTKKKSWEESREFGSYSTISRDGKQVAYEWGPSPSQLRVAALLGTTLGEPRRLPLSDEYREVRPFDWSPDGKWIAVHLLRADLSGQLGVVAVQDGSLRALQSTGWRGPSNMVFSADGQFVAFDLPASDTVTERDVFVLAIDGSRGVRAVEHPADDTLVGFSADGRQLLFASDRTRAKALWAQPFSDGKPQGSPVNVKPDFGSPWIHGITRSGTLYVTKTVSDQDIYIAPVDLAAGKLAGPPKGIQAYPRRGRPDWSADGKQMAHLDCPSFGSCALFIRNMETGQTRQVRHGMHYVTRHRWSPDGRSFITSGRDLKGRTGIYKMDALTGETTLVLAGPSLNVQPAWSADGLKIIYGQGRKLLERDLATGKERELRPIPVDAGRVSVSPGGRFIAYIEENAADKTSMLMAAPAEGGAPRELLRVRQPESLGPVYLLSWTLGGDALLLPKRLTTDPRNGPRELWLAPVTGGAPRKLDIDVSNWTSDLGMMGMTPDGRHIAFMAGKESMEVWALENFLPALKAGK